ncbi:MAG: DeoR/GlpR family DNA-binding transcription regulator [Bacilli bacterium]
MLSKKRQEIIIELVQQNHFVKMQDIIDATQASESTIRRDLSQLEGKGKLVRLHGGAQSMQKVSHEQTYTDKMVQAIDDKVKIAQQAAALIQNDMHIYLDAGTTTMQMVPFLMNKKITVVTNSLPLTNALLQHQIPTHMIGGLLKPSTQALVGYYAREGLLRYHFDMAFVGMNGIDVQFGYTTPDPDEAMVKQTVLQQAKQSYVLADDTKFSEKSFCIVAPLHSAKIITHCQQSEKLQQFTDKTEVINAL